MKSIIIFVIFTTAYAATCPPGQENGFLPDPYDCTSFYACVGGIAIKEKCPTGLEWNDQAKNCDWPENANCHESSSTPAPPTTSGPTSEATSAGPTTEYPTSCPPKDGPTDVLLKNPKDCHSFFKCLKGKPYLIQCPAGQEWADQLKRCDWPEIANCKVEGFY